MTNETMSYYKLFLLSFSITLAFLQQIRAVEYAVANNAGNTAGSRVFETRIGVDYSRQTLIQATQFIWKIFQQSTDADRKNIQRVSLFVENFDLYPAYASGDQIHVSATYIGTYRGDVVREFTGIIYHEATHVWQWDGGRQTPGWLIEGIADYVRLKSGYIPSHWMQPGEGENWTQRSDVTARFLDYLEGRRSGFVAELNKMMRGSYNDFFFDQLLGEPVGRLWADYKAQYGNIP